MQRFLKTFGQKILVLILFGFVSLTNLLILGPQAAWADPPSQSLSAEEKLERAYDVYDQDAGMREEIYQRKLEEGQDPEKLPKSLRRIKSLDGKEVPPSSVLESTVSKVKEFFGKRAD